MLLTILCVCFARCWQYYACVSSMHLAGRYVASMFPNSWWGLLNMNYVMGN